MLLFVLELYRKARQFLVLKIWAIAAETLKLIKH
jgi:hypothetical protein